MVIRSTYRALISLLPPEKRAAIRYYRNLGCWPDLKNPASLNEKVLKRILSERDPMFSFYADKLAVRGYVEKLLGSDALVPLLATFENAEDLLEIENWAGIVIKPNHGAGMVRVFEKDVPARIKLRTVALAKIWLRRDYSKLSDEWHYKDISPRLLVEKKISDPGEHLRDYKFHRFKQKDGSFVQILQVITNRTSKGYETVFFDICDLDNIWHSPFGHSFALSNMEKSRIKEIIYMNEVLCPEYAYLRIDWYITKDAVYFGEITFTPGAGMSKSVAGDFGKVMGRLWVS